MRHGSDLRTVKIFSPFFLVCTNKQTTDLHYAVPSPKQLSYFPACLRIKLDLLQASRSGKVDGL